MTLDDKINSYTAIQSFLEHLGYKKNINYIEKLKCKINIHKENPNYYFDDNLELENNAFNLYFIIYYPYLSSFNLTTRINSNKYLFFWNDIEKKLSVEYENIIINFKQ